MIPYHMREMAHTTRNCFPASSKCFKCKKEEEENYKLCATSKVQAPSKDCLQTVAVVAYFLFPVWTKYNTQFDFSKKHLWPFEFYERQQIKSCASLEFLEIPAIFHVVMSHSETRKLWLTGAYHVRPLVGLGTLSLYCKAVEKNKQLPTDRTWKGHPSPWPRLNMLMP